MQSMLSGSHGVYTLGGACNKDGTASPAGGIATVISLLVDGQGQPLPPSSMKYAAILSGVPAGAKLDVFVSARDTNGTHAGYFGRPRAATAIRHVAADTGDLLMVTSGDELQQPIHPMDDRSLGSNLRIQTQMLRSSVSSNSSGTISSVSAMGMLEAGSTSAFRWDFKPGDRSDGRQRDCVVVTAIAQTSSEWNETAAFNPFLDGAAGFAPIERIGMSRCGWMMFHVSPKAALGGLSGQPHEVSVVPISKRYASVGLGGSAALLPTTGSARAAIAQGSAGTVVVETTSGAATLQMPPPLWHGGRAPSSIHILALALGNSSESYEVLHGVLDSVGPAGLGHSCSVQSSNVPSSWISGGQAVDADQSPLCTLCAQSIDAQTSPLSPWPVCVGDLLSGAGSSLALDVEDDDSESVSVPDPKGGGVGHWIKISVGADLVSGAYGQPLKLTGLGPSAAFSF